MVESLQKKKRKAHQMLDLFFASFIITECVLRSNVFCFLPNDIDEMTTIQYDEMRKKKGKTKLQQDKPMEIGNWV